MVERKYKGEGKSEEVKKKRKKMEKGKNRWIACGAREVTLGN